MEDCPYCGKEIEINHDDGYGFSEDRIHEQVCNHCDKTFTYTTSIHYYYDLEKAPCLNEEADHEWKPTICYPMFYAKMRCKYCGEERAPTIEEKEKYNIPIHPPTY